jgi:hypothetical protein
MPDGLGRVAVKAGGATLVFLAVLAIDLSQGIGPQDDAWTLQVFDRVGNGDALYRDVAFGSTPLSVWIGAGVVELLGSQIIVLKGLVAACTTAAALLAARIAAQLGVGRIGQVLVAGASLAFVDFPSANLYTPLSYLLLLVSFSAILTWRSALEDRPDDHRATISLLIAGAAAGLCAATKQNIGLLAVAAVVVSVALLRPAQVAGRWTRATEIGTVLGSAAVAAVIPVIPVALDGALGDLVTFAFHKGEYVRRGSLSYLEGFEELGDLARNPLSDPAALADYAAFLIPPMASIALVATLRRNTYRLTATVALFVGVAIIGVFPRADVTHANDAVPACAIAIAWSLTELGAGMSRATRYAGLVVAVTTVTLGLASVVGQGIMDALRDRPPSDIPHFEGPLVATSVSDGVGGLATSLRQFDGGSNHTFILMPSAATYYLAAGLSNPTRFDYPLVNTFGTDGQDEVIEAIRHRAVRSVCLGPFRILPKSEGIGTTSSRLRPRRLTRYVRAHMARVRTLKPTDEVARFARCTLYETT